MPTAADMAQATVDDVRAFMEEHGLPGALLPDGARPRSFDEATGRFEVVLPSRVHRRVSGFKVRYSTTLSGRIVQGRLEKLQGVKARGGPLWVRVHTIEARGRTTLRFGAGPVRKDLPVTAFAA